MSKLRFLLLAALCALSAGPASANFVVEPSYAEKMAIADLVVIGTVTAVDRGDAHGIGSSATLSVLQRLKGESAGTLMVATDSPIIAEMNPRCCEAGATYVMFLRVGHGRPQSVWGRYGMVRIGGPGSGIRADPNGETIVVPSRQN
jgi:hypothetical protein